ncbi:alpha/beta hydrolase [Croceicoccus ponticola]|uniref:Alpha/beta hydrolase n=1 Tax=Croceicoccus ponticola TaxID=2217664 RepID=A0A437H120_9SPHN|nr:alpha/beta hydrolase [Croceicoccus ponticola]RVQ69279.1 alpha/beta hydrolase [Croceicoccus ponticola]
MQPPHYIRIGTPDAPKVVFAHGWGRTHRDFIPVAEALAPTIDAYLFDLPGHGKSERPDAAWGTVEYAEYMARYVTMDLGIDQCVWVGHSFGGRMGLRLGVQSPGMMRHMVIVAGAGVPRDISTAERWKRKWKGRKFQKLKAAATTEDELIELEKRFGSPDYVMSRETGMRDIFVKTIAEDQSADLPRIPTETTLIYGSADTETPPEIGRKIAALVPNSTYIECPHYDHISILDRGRHQIALAIKEAVAA